MSSDKDWNVEYSAPLAGKEAEPTKGAPIGAEANFINDVKILEEFTEHEELCGRVPSSCTCGLEEVRGRVFAYLKDWHSRPAMNTEAPLVGQLDTIAFAQERCANKQAHDWETCEHCHYLVDSLDEWIAASVSKDQPGERRAAIGDCAEWLETHERHGIPIAARLLVGMNYYDEPNQTGALAANETKPLVRQKANERGAK